ncbi:MAG: phosphatase PAP2 family protein [Candidatus Kerfeldbacteria bacterium]|nr:phosphatase PAP2 family protein [Candidatus Kerfeldbacteria bacterium]
MFHQSSHQVRAIVVAGFVIATELFFLKYIPMWVWGNNIRFDASMHIATAIFVLYVLWFFIDQNKNWRTPFFIFSALVLFVISVQRIADNAHNDIGLLLGLLAGLTGIGASQWGKFKKRLKF